MRQAIGFHGNASRDDRLRRALRDQDMIARTCSQNRKAAAFEVERNLRYPGPPIGTVAFPSENGSVQRASDAGLKSAVEPGKVQDAVTPGSVAVDMRCQRNP